MFESGGSVQAGAEAPGVLTGVPEGEWATVLREQHAVIARAQFREVDAIATIYLTRCAEDERRGCNDAFQGEFASVEVGFVFRWSEPAAQRVIGLSLDLRWRLHATRTEFASGRIDQQRAQAISDALAGVSEDKVDLIERMLLDGSEHLNLPKLRAKARRLVARHDPEGTKTRRESAEADRDVRFRANEDGTCTIEGALPGPGGQIVATRLRRMCFEVCSHDPRTFAQRRADALVALAAGTGYLACACGRVDCTATGAAATSSAVGPDVTAAAHTDQFGAAGTPSATGVVDPVVSNPVVPDRAGHNPTEPNLVAPSPTASNPTGLNPVAPSSTGLNPVAPNPVAPSPTASNPTGPNPTRPNRVGPNQVGPNPTRPNLVVSNPVASDPVAPSPTAASPTGPNPVAPSPTGLNPVASDPVASNPVGSDPTAPDQAATRPDSISQATSNSTATCTTAGDHPEPGARPGGATRPATDASAAADTTPGDYAPGRSLPAPLPPLPSATIHVGVNATTLLGLDDLPGYLAGHGWIDADLARQIAADGTWRKVLTLTDADRDAILDALCGHTGTGEAGQSCDPPPDREERGSADHRAAADHTCPGTPHSTHAPASTHAPSSTHAPASAPTRTSGIPVPEQDSQTMWLSGRRLDTLPHGAILGIGRALKAAGITPTAIRDRSRTRREQLTYRPSARLAEIVRARDGGCRFPGCTARAAICDLDHTVPFDHAHPERGGLTVEQNLACLCRRHHRLKTRGLWTVRQLGGGRLEWTTPTGELVVTEPAGAFTGSADGRLADEALAAAHGLTLTGDATLANLFTPYRGRDVEADLSNLLDIHSLTAPLAWIADPSAVTILDGSDPAGWSEFLDPAAAAGDPAPY